MPHARKAGFMALAFLALTCVGGAVTARADSFQLTPNNFGQPGSLGTVTTTLQMDGTIVVNVQLAAGYVIHNAGVGFNAAPGITVVAITDFEPDLFVQDLSPHNFDGFGSFAYSADSLQSTAQARATNTSSVIFVVSASGGFTSASQLINFAVQVAPMEGDETGFVTSTSSAVPEPATMLLLGTGLAGVAAGARKRRKAAKTD